MNILINKLTIALFTIYVGILIFIPSKSYLEPCFFNVMLDGSEICTDAGTRCDPPARGICFQKKKECLCGYNIPSPEPQTTSRSRWIEENGIINLPAPGNQITLTFNLDTTFQNAFYRVELNNYFGGGTIQVMPTIGTITILATRRLPVSQQHIVDFSLISFLAKCKSVNIPGLGETGINHLSYDSLKGEFDINTGKLLLTGIGKITNIFFPPINPVLFTTHQWGTVNLNIGEIIQDATAFDDIPLLSEGFNDIIFPPPDWNISYMGINYWTRDPVSSFGVGSGSAKFNFRNAPHGITQSLITRKFINSTLGDSLKFNHAYAPFPSGTDSLIIETSFNYGITYSTLARLYGKASGGPLNTAPVIPIPFTPASSQWATKRYALPVGTNKIKFRARSGFGNNLYLDSISSGKYISGAAPSTITVVPEGFLNTSANNLNSEDTVKAYLRSNSAPYAVTDSGKIVIDSVTMTGSIIFSNALSGTYYVVVKHKSSIETWSKPGGEIFTQGSAFIYDFTSSQIQAFGNNMVLKGVKWCIYSGDVNQDGVVDASDLGLIDNDAYNFVSGYKATDLTGDGVIDATDLSIADNNASGFVAVIRP